MAEVIDFEKARKQLKNKDRQKEEQKRLFEQVGEKYYNPDDPRENWYHEFDEGEKDQDESD